MTKFQANKKAKELLKKVKGKGWKICFHNYGLSNDEKCWTSFIYNKGMIVFVHDYDDKYDCVFSSNKNCFQGDKVWSEAYFSSKDPNEVIERQLKLAKDYVEKISKVVKDFEENYQKTI